MRDRAVTLLSMIVVVMFASASRAQTTWSDHARVSIDVGAQQTTSTFTSTANVPVYQQLSTVTAHYDVPQTIVVDGGVILRVSGGFGVGVGASWFSKSEPAQISGSIPHPLLASRPRSISGTSGPLERQEIAGFLDAAYVFSASRVDLAVSGGPSFFTVTQDLVGNVTFTDVAPYDTAAFTGVVVSREMATAIGFNAGVDLGVKLSKNVGVGGVFRYSHASATFPLANSASGVHADVGGAQAGGGLRLYF